MVDTLELPGRIIGAIPIYIGRNACLLLVSRENLVIVVPNRDLLKEIILSPLTLSRYARTQAIVKLSKKEPDELLETLKKMGCKIIMSIKKDMIKYIEFKRRLFGHGVIVMIIHTIDGKKYDFNLVYGPGKGINKDEAIGNAISKLESVGIRIVSKI